MKKWGGLLREINIKLWHNADTQDWSLEINGRFHEHVSSETLTGLVECGLIVAAKSLIEVSDRSSMLQSASL